MSIHQPGRLGKTRTREHVLADLSINYVERYVLLCGFSVLRVHPDYGYDLIMATYNAGGEIEPGVVYIQVKATDQLRISKDGTTVSCRVSRRDLGLWLREKYPVVLVLYDGKRDEAYWLNMQQYFAGRAGTLFGTSDWVHVRVPTGNRVNRQSVRRMAQHKRRIHEQL